MLRHLVVTVFGIATFLLPVSLEGGCKTDCRETYESEVESCKLLHDDPDDTDELTLCIEAAKDDYDSCIDDCDD